jgi:hypothetical protein
VKNRYRVAVPEGLEPPTSSLDRGSQYTGKEFRELVTTLGGTPSKVVRHDLRPNESQWGVTQYHWFMRASRKRKGYSPIVMSVVLLVVFWVDLSFSDKQHLIGSGYEDGWQLIFTTSPISGFIGGLTTLALVASFVVFIISIFRMNWQGIILLIVMLGTLFIAFGSAFEQAGDYKDASKVKDAQGNEYHLLLSHFCKVRIW